jgi:hypothetical protein
MRIWGLSMQLTIGFGPPFSTAGAFRLRDLACGARLGEKKSRASSCPLTSSSSFQEEFSDQFQFTSLTSEFV